MTNFDLQTSVSQRIDPAVPQVQGMGGGVMAAFEIPDWAMAQPPASDLGEVAVAGRKAGEEYRASLANPGTAENAIVSFATNLGLDLGHGGTFDHQRGPGNSITGFEQRPQFRNISNINVGVYGQQAGLSREELLTIAGAFAGAKSSNSNSKEPYGLDPQTRQFIERGYQIGASGKFDKNPP